MCFICYHHDYMVVLLGSFTLVFDAGTHCVDKADMKLLEFLSPLSPEAWDLKWEASPLALLWLYF